MTENGYCKYLSNIEAGRLLKTGIIEFPEEITLEDVTNAENGHWKIKPKSIYYRGEINMKNFEINAKNTMEVITIEELLDSMATGKSAYLNISVPPFGRMTRLNCWEKL